MGTNIVWTVFRKELTDLLRDRKTLIGTFVIPMVVIPFVFFLLGTSYNNVEKEARSYVPISISGQSVLVDYLKQTPGVKLLNSPNPEADLQQGKLRAIISIPDGFDQQVKAGKPVKLAVAYDSTNQKSVYARSIIEEAVKNTAPRLWPSGCARRACPSRRSSRSRPYMTIRRPRTVRRAACWPGSSP